VEDSSKLPSKPSAPLAKPLPDPAPPLSFEEALRELEGVVAQLETGGVPLEASLQLLGRGQQLALRCEQVLSEAELSLQTLVLTEEGELELEEGET